MVANEGRYAHDHPSASFPVRRRVTVEDWVQSLRCVPRVTVIAETGRSAFVGCQLERGIGQQLSATKAVKPIPGFPPNNFRLPCDAGFYLLDERSDTKVIHAVMQK